VTLLINTIYPDAPRVAVGAVVIYEKKVLLVLRGKPPAEGLWAIPGGSVDLGETLQMAAEREVLEETGLHVKAGAADDVRDARWFSREALTEPGLSISETTRNLLHKLMTSYD
jgi:8-oxo-dGTP pyrophosphatase MutT (NUDIX family)